MKPHHLFLGFILSISFFGLMPIWVVSVILMCKNQCVDFSLVLQDGGLFFFTSTTFATYVYTYIVKGEKSGLASLLTAFAMISSIVMVVIFTYVYSVSIIKSESPKFSDDYFYIQLCGTIFSVAYSIFIEAHTGGFKPMRKYHYR